MVTEIRAWLRGRASLVLLGAVLVAVSVLVAPAAPASAAITGNVDFNGHGFGHGRGLGQWGAYGYATIYSWPYERILNHYYGNASVDRQGDGPVTVVLTAQDGQDLVVTSGRDFTVGGFSVAGGSAARVQARPDGTFVLSTSYGCASPVVWTTTIADSRVTSSVAAPGSDLQAMLSLCTPTGSTQYRGELSVVWGNNAQRTVNTVGMEDYLRGVVPRESPASWGDAAGGQGIEALKAQAVAARSYAWSEGRSSYAKTCDTTACQVYAGAGLNLTPIEDRRSDAAIAATAGVVLRTGSGAIVRTEFSASTGGHTAGGAFPAVPDDGDTASPHHNWTTSVPATTIAGAYGVGELTDIRVTARNGLGADGGRATQVLIAGTTKTVTVSGNDVRTKLGLKSDWFTPAVAGGGPAPAPAPAPVQPVVYEGSGNVPGASGKGVAFGQRGDIPLACDWDGNGVSTLGVFRAGTFFVTDQPDSGIAQTVFGFGQAGDQPVCGDWDGNGTETVGVYRGGTVFLRNSNSTGIADGHYAFGQSGDRLVAGDWNGDGFDTVGVWRAGLFHLSNSNLRPTTDATIPYGDRADLPTVGDWDGNGTDTIGVFRGGTFLVRNSNTAGTAEMAVAFGDRGDKPLPGRWSPSGGDVVGVARQY